MSRRRTKLCPCMICERLYAEIEEAEVCEQSHSAPQNPREKGDDDGVEYADPRDARDERRFD